MGTFRRNIDAAPRLLQHFGATMEKPMKVQNAVLASVAGVGFLALSAASASAAIVCSGNVCWHTTERYEYPAESQVVVHEDTWRPEASANIRFREHTGRGYWRDDKWTEW